MRVVLILSLVIFISACSHEKKVNELSKKHLDGKVKIMEESTFAILEKYGEVQKGDFKGKFVTIFDKYGNKIEITYHSPFGLAANKNTYKYDANQNLVENCSYDEKGALEHREQYRYDNNGREVEIIYSNAAIVLGNCKYNYSLDLKKVELMHSSSDGSSFKSVNYFDENKFLIEEIYYDEQGNLKLSERYRYDKEGNNVEYNSFNNKGECEVSRKSSFNEKGNEYNSTTIYKNGNSITHTFNYEKFDKVGNWVTSVVTTNGNKEKIIERELQYF